MLLFRYAPLTTAVVAVYNSTSMGKVQPLSKALAREWAVTVEGDLLMSREEYRKQIEDEKRSCMEGNARQMAEKAPKVAEETQRVKDV